MQAVETEKLRVALEGITLGTVDLGIDWASLGSEIKGSQALVLVESACLALGGSTADDEFSEPAIMPLRRFDRDGWYATPHTRMILELLYDVDKDTFIWLQGTFRHVEKNDPTGRLSRSWDGEFVTWAIKALRDTLEAGQAESKPVDTYEATVDQKFPEVKSVDLNPTIKKLAYNLGYGRLYRGQLKKTWWPSDAVVAAAALRGVPQAFSRQSIMVRSFIGVYTQERHDSTRDADTRFVEYIVDRHRRVLRLYGVEAPHSQKAS